MGLASSVLKVVKKAIAQIHGENFCASSKICETFLSLHFCRLQYTLISMGGIKFDEVRQCEVRSKVIGPKISTSIPPYTKK